MITAILGYLIISACAIAALAVAIRQTPPPRPPVRVLRPELVPHGGLSGEAVAVALMECGFDVMPEWDQAGGELVRIVALRPGIRAVASLDPMQGWSISAPPTAGYPGMLYYPVSPADLIGFTTRVYAQGPNAVRSA